MQDTFTNFATTTLVTAMTASGPAAITVASGTGSLFPSASFYVTIDTEIVAIVSRSGDTLTIGARGQDGTVAASHASGAGVQLCVIAQNMNHLWQNVADTYVPEVPPLQQGLVPSPYDNEFETQGAWILYPQSLPNGATFAIGSGISSTGSSGIRSHLVLNRGTTDNTLYTAYIPFTPGSGIPFTVTAKVSQAVNVPRNQNMWVGTYLFVADQSNPASGADVGNRFRMDVYTQASANPPSSNGPSILYSTNNTVYATYDHNSSPQQIGPQAMLNYGHPVFVRLAYDGAGNWSGYVGDGYTYSLLAYLQNAAFVPASLGFSFFAGFTSPYATLQTVMIDYCRVTIGQVEPPFAGV